MTINENAISEGYFLEGIGGKFMAIISHQVTISDLLNGER